MENIKKYKTIDAKEAKEIIQNTSGAAILIAFTAEWTGNGKMMDNFYEELAKEYFNDVYFLRIDTEKSSDYADDFGVQQVPTTLLFRDKVVVDRIEGLVPKVMIKERIDRILTENKFF